MRRMVTTGMVVLAGVGLTSCGSHKADLDLGPGAQTTPRTSAQKQACRRAALRTLLRASNRPSSTAQERQVARGQLDAAQHPKPGQPNPLQQACGTP